MTRIFCLYHKNDTMSTDMALAFEEAGCQVFHELLEIREGKVLFNPADILKKVILFSPDLFFFINQFGIDPECQILKSLSYLKVKQAGWFIDNPFYYYAHLTSMKTLRNFHCFVWDRFYISLLKEEGLSNVFYLPQATNPKRFKPLTFNEWEKTHFTHSLSFAGNLDLTLFYQFLNHWLSEYPEFEKALPSLLTESAQQILQFPSIPSIRILTGIIDKKYSQALPVKGIWDLAKILEYKLSGLIRKEMVQSIEEYPLVIWGDPEEWTHYISKAKVLGRVSYFKNMPKVFNGSTINLNISRIQQRTGTNQRVFDVPACGSFLITDYREELETLFDTDSEVVCYRNFDDLKKKITLYQDPEKRKRVINSAMNKVLANHTYLQRAQHILALMKDSPVQNEDPKSRNPKALFSIIEAFLELRKKEEALEWMTKLKETNAIFGTQEYNLLLEKLNSF